MRRRALKCTVMHYIVELKWGIRKASAHANILVHCQDSFGQSDKPIRQLLPNEAYKDITKKLA
jgi:hypothetical protein